MNRLPKRIDGIQWSLCLALGALTTLGCNRRSDTKLQEMFDNHRDDFTRLAMMSEQDRHIVRIAFKTNDPDPDSSEPGLSEQRWEQYRVLFRKLEIADGIERRRDFPGVVFFWADCNGSAISRDCKGYAYSEGSPAPILGDLNKLAPGVAFKPLSRNWYLFRDGG
jgi:hypothetical protein